MEIQFRGVWFCARGIVQSAVVLFPFAYDTRSFQGLSVKIPLLIIFDHILDALVPPWCS